MNPTHSVRNPVGIWLAVTALILTYPKVGLADDFDRAPIHYASRTGKNVVTDLQERLAAGKVQLEHEDHFGYLRGLLRELRVPVSSQTLVYSKTSLQRHRIAPRTPRALYFSDEVYVGFCQNGDVLEISAVDAELGAVFYTLDQTDSRKPTITRQGDNCLICHGSSQTNYVPGHMLRSVYSDGQGYPILASGTYRIDQTSPLKQRWGGWYVTGTHGEQNHLGNLIVRTRTVHEPVDNAAGQNVTSLKDRIDCSCYPSGHSDIVALMVFEHQAEAHNLLTKANFQTRLALHQEEGLNRELGKPKGTRWDSTTTRIRSVGEPLVKYLLFSGEAPLEGRIRGTSGFAEEFSKLGDRDGKGRSLRDFDLNSRLFKYPCSYLIYSPSFDGLPPLVKDYVYQRIWDILNGGDTSKDFAHLTESDRQAIREILLATKKGLPDYWRMEP